jgi:hypothetical protein
MLSIKDGRSLSRVLKSAIDDRVKQLLMVRRRQFGSDIADQVHFAVVQPADTAADLTQTVGFPLVRCDGFEPDWVQDHGFAFELVFDLTEDFTQVVIIPVKQGVDSQLINFAAKHASAHA